MTVVQKLLNSSSSLDLKLLSDAISLKYFGYNEYSIRESYKITENMRMKDPKFTVLRHALSHPVLEKSWFDRFTKHYDKHHFDYKRCDRVTKEVIIDFESGKTQQELGKLAIELINKRRTLLNL
jgi:hypothetical protein